MLLDAKFEHSGTFKKLLYMYLWFAEKTSTSKDRLGAMSLLSVYCVSFHELLYKFKTEQNSFKQVSTWFLLILNNGNITDVPMILLVIH